MNDSWYDALQRPPLTPPSTVFSPVWTILYIMIAIAIILYVRTPDKQGTRWVYPLLVLHLGTNFVWTWFFFGLQSPGLALIDILVLDVTLWVLIWAFFRAKPIAGWLLVPYLLWVSFATYLNAGFWWLNR